MADTPILRQRETLFVTNVSNDSIRITDIPSIPVIKPGQRIDLLVYTSLNNAQSSTVIGAYISNGRLDSEEYLHTHDDKTDLTLVEPLIDGDNADDLHKHKHNNLEGLDEEDYQHLTSAGKTDFITLTDGGNADDLHTHDIAGSIDHNKLDNLQGGASDDYYHLKKTQHDNLTAITATSNEINQALDGIGSNVTSTNLDTLVNNGNANGLHNHGASGAPDHNDLNGLNVGDYLHLTSAEKTDFNTLTDDSNADSLHKHNHDSLQGFVANEHINHTAVILTAGSGLSGGGDISSSRSFALDIDSLSTDTIESSDYIPFYDGSNKKITYTNFNSTLDHNLLSNTLWSVAGHTIDTHLLPNLSCSYDLGSSIKRWNNIYYCGEIYDTSGKTLQERFVDRDLLNGTFRESFDCLATSDGVTITATLDNPEDPSGGILTQQFDTGDFEMLSGTDIELTAGSDSSPQNNYIYILASNTGVLVKSTSDWPIEEHIKVSYFFIPSAIEVQSLGAYITQNWNDHLENAGLMGHLAHMGEKIRLGSKGYFSGLNPNGTDQDTNSSYFNYISSSESYFKYSSGKMYQMHKQNLPAKDTQLSSDDIHVINWSGDSYHEISELNDVVLDSTGSSLSNKYFNLFFFVVGNKTDTYAPIMCQLPSGSYNSQVSAENDVDGLDNLIMPREFNLDSSVGVPLCRLTLRYTGGTSTLTHISTTDLRTTVIGAGAGGIGGVTDFADNQFDIFNVTDSTKILNFDISNVSPATVRTITMADRDLDLSTPVFDSVTLGDTLSPPTSLTITFNTDSTDGLIVYTGATDTFDFGSSNLITSGNINLDSNSSRFYFGSNQDASIYFDGTDLNISLNEPSQAGDINLTDNVNITGILTTNILKLHDDPEDKTITIIHDRVFGAVPLVDATITIASGGGPHDIFLTNWNDAVIGLDQDLRHTAAAGATFFKLTVTGSNPTLLRFLQLGVTSRSATAGEWVLDSVGRTQDTAAPGQPGDDGEGHYLECATGQASEFAGQSGDGGSCLIKIGTKGIGLSGATDGVDGMFAVGDGGTTDYIEVSPIGDLSFNGDAGFYPRVVRQDAEPANGTGSTQIDDEEQLIWIDTNDSNRVYLMFNDNTNTNIVKIELT